MPDLPEHVATNRAFWDGLASGFVDRGRCNWESEEPGRRYLCGEVWRPRKRG